MMIQSSCDACLENIPEKKRKHFREFIGSMRRLPQKNIMFPS